MNDLSKVTQLLGARTQAPWFLALGSFHRVTFPPRYRQSFKRELANCHLQVNSGLLPVSAWPAREEWFLHFKNDFSKSEGITLHDIEVICTPNLHSRRRFYQNTSNVCSLTYCPQLLSCSKGRDVRPTKPKILTTWLFIEKACQPLVCNIPRDPLLCFSGSTVKGRRFILSQYQTPNLQLSHHALNPYTNKPNDEWRL